MCRLTPIHSWLKNASTHTSILAGVRALATCRFLQNLRLAPLVAPATEREFQTQIRTENAAPCAIRPVERYGLRRPVPIRSCFSFFLAPMPARWTMHPLCPNSERISAMAAILLAVRLGPA
jgi:hypothetical protein